MDANRVCRDVKLNSKVRNRALLRTLLFEQLSLLASGPLHAGFFMAGSPS